MVRDQLTEHQTGGYEFTLCFKFCWDRSATWVLWAVRRQQKAWIACSEYHILFSERHVRCGDVAGRCSKNKLKDLLRVYTWTETRALDTLPFTSLNRLKCFLASGNSKSCTYTELFIGRTEAGPVPSLELFHLSALSLDWKPDATVVLSLPLSCNRTRRKCFSSSGCYRGMLWF